MTTPTATIPDSDLFTGTARYTRADYALLPEGFPGYLLDGFLVREAAPTFGHQSVVFEIGLRLEPVAPGRVLTSPVDVALDDLNVLQPDVVVLGPGERRQAAGRLRRPPVLVVEVVSPGTARRDRGPKTAAYLRGGVAEVWLVDPVVGAIEVVTAEGRRSYGSLERAVSAAVPGFGLAWSDLADGPGD